MKIQETQTKKLTITDVQGLDAIAVYLEDMGVGAGKITITCFGEAWSAYWSHMGEKHTISSFFQKAGNDYLIRKLSSGIRSQEVDYGNIDNFLKKEIVKQRRCREISRAQARDFWDTLEDIDCIGGKDFIEHGSGNGVMYELFGDEWWEHLPQRGNHHYEYLDRIVKTIKEALALSEQQEAA